MNAAQDADAEVDTTAPGDPLRKRTAQILQMADIAVARARTSSAKTGRGAQGQRAATRSKRDRTTSSREAPRVLYQQLYPETRSEDPLQSILYRDGKLYYDYQVFDPAVKTLGHLQQLEEVLRATSTRAKQASSIKLDSFW